MSFCLALSLYQGGAQGSGVVHTETEQERIFIMETKVINDIEMVKLEDLYWSITETLRFFYDSSTQTCPLTLQDSETWLCTLKEVWSLEHKKDYDYCDERQKHARKAVRHYFVSVEVALRIASLYKDSYLYRKLMGEVMEEK